MDNGRASPTSHSSTRVWIDDPNPVFRLGLASCLKPPAFSVVGQSTRFEPEPPLHQVDVLVFDLGERRLAEALRRHGNGPARLVGLVAGSGPDRADVPDQCTVLVRSDLTPESFVESVNGFAPLPPPPGPATRSAFSVPRLRSILSRIERRGWGR